MIGAVACSVSYFYPELLGGNGPDEMGWRGLSQCWAWIGGGVINAMLKVFEPSFYVI